MDRRGFLKALGVGGVAIVAAPTLVLPKARSLAGAAPRLFTPPAGGWRKRVVMPPQMSYARYVEYGRPPEPASLWHGSLSERLEVEWTTARGDVFHPGDVVDLDTIQAGRALVWVTDVRYDYGRGTTVRAIGWNPSYPTGELESIKKATPGGPWSARRSLEPLPRELLWPV